MDTTSLGFTGFLSHDSFCGAIELEILRERKSKSLGESVQEGGGFMI